MIKQEKILGWKSLGSGGGGILRPFLDSTDNVFFLGGEGGNGNFFTKLGTTALQSLAAPNQMPTWKKKMSLSTIDLSALQEDEALHQQQTTATVVPQYFVQFLNGEGLGLLDEVEDLDIPVSNNNYGDDGGPDLQASSEYEPEQVFPSLFTDDVDVEAIVEVVADEGDQDVSITDDNSASQSIFGKSNTIQYDTIQYNTIQYNT